MSLGADDRPTLWISSAGTAAGYGIAAAVRRHWGADVRVVGADTNPPHLIAARPLCDAFERVPPIADASFASSVPALVRGHDVDFYVAVHDEELLLLRDWDHHGVIPGVGTNSPSTDSARICLDKAQAHAWLLDHSFPSPETYLPDDAQWEGLPLVVKPRKGHGGEGVRTVRSAVELRRVTERSDVVVQEECQLPEVTIDVFRSLNGRQSAAVCRERLEVKAGVCTKARVFRDSHLESLGCAIADQMGLRGAVCVQVMRGAHQKGWCVTDINPRPGAGAPLSAAAGFDALGAMVADGLGLTTGTDLLEGFASGERFVIRHYEEVLVGE